MNESFEREHFDGDENISPKLYKRVYIASGKRRIRYSAIFTDWQGVRRKVALGADRSGAIRKIYDLDKKNHAEVDFTEQRKKREARGMTFAKFIQANNVEFKSPWHEAPLLAFFGNKPIAQIDDKAVLDYRTKRAGEKIIKHGKESAKLISPTSVNKELSTLRKILKLATTKGFAHRVTRFEMATETSRNRVLTAEEYTALLNHCPDWLRRAVAFSWETSLSRSDLFNLTWNEIDLAESIIELKDGRAKTGKPQVIPIYTDTLKTLIGELQQERRRVPNAAGLVLTDNGQPLDKLKFEYHFRRAVRLAGIKNFTLHDIRHAVATRLARENIPTAAAMLVLGHSSVASHKRYQNLGKQDLKAVFGIVPVVFPEKSGKKKIARK
jgi:integrase